MNFLHHILRLLSVILFSVFGANTALAVTVTTSEVIYPQTKTTHFAQGDDVGFAARAPPMAVPNVAITGGVTVMQGGVVALHGQETVAVFFGFDGDLDAPNTAVPPRFVTDAAGNTIDVNATKNLTSLSPSDVNFQAGRGSPTFDSHAAPNSYANLGNGHAIVYGPDGRALYDVSAGRVKVVVWNTNPNTGQSFPNWGSDSKAFVDNVPQSLLDDLGLN